MVKILGHFDEYPLLTNKTADNLLLTRVIKMMPSGAHLTEEGLHKIISIRAAMNRGLNPKIKAAYPDIVKEETPDITVPKTIDRHWIAGFANGDGTFSATITGKTDKAP